jgi:hypothetical protein
MGQETHLPDFNDEMIGTAAADNNWTIMEAGSRCLMDWIDYVIGGEILRWEMLLRDSKDTSQFLHGQDSIKPEDGCGSKSTNTDLTGFNNKLMIHFLDVFVVMIPISVVSANQDLWLAPLLSGKRAVWQLLCFLNSSVYFRSRSLSKIIDVV